MFHVAASNTSTLTTSRPLVWTGRALSGLVILFLVVDAAMKIAALPIVAEAAMTIDWTVDPGFWRAMGLLLLAITALYAWPRIGAILHRVSWRCSRHACPDRQPVLHLHTVRGLFGRRPVGRPVAA
jgi:hypothetical protein